MPHPQSQTKLHLLTRVAMTSLVVAVVSFLILGHIEALYEDQVGNFDWYQQYIGHVTWSSFEQVAGGRRKVLLATNEGVIAAINAGPGTIAWRQVVAGGIAVVLHERSTLWTVSGGNHMILRSWETETGFLKWEASIEFKSPQYTQWSLTTQWRPGGILMSLAGNKKDQLVIILPGLLVVYSTRSGKEVWKISLPDSTLASYVISKDTGIDVWFIEDQKLSIQSYNTNERKILENRKMVAKNINWFTNNTSCVVQSGNDNVICKDDNNGQLYYSNMNGLFHPLTIEGHIPSLSEGPLEDAGNSFIHIGPHLVSIDTTSYVVKLVCTGCRMRTASDEKGTKLGVRIEESGSGLKIHMLSTETTEESLDVNVGVIRGGVVYVELFFIKKSGNWRVIIIREDASVSFISNTGDLIWVREEGLASIVAVAMVDLPSAQLATEEFLSLLEDESNPVLLGIKRLTLQFTLAKDMIQDISRKGVASIFKRMGTEELLRDDFNTKKMVIAVTSRCKVYGINSESGQIIWQLFLPSLHPLNEKSLLYVVRTVSHPPDPPLMILLGTDEQCSSGSSIFEFNPITGKLTNQICLQYHVIQATLLPLTDHTHRRVLLMLDNEGQAHCYPDGCDFHDQGHTIPLFLYTANIINGELKGFQIIRTDKGIEETTREVWRIALPKNEKILSVINKVHDHAHSLGRVRPDRSVQYKYLNPNLVAMVTQTTDQVKPNLNLYLLDVVSGGVVYQVTHKLATVPINIVLCENWVVYSYYNIKFYRQEIVVIELYDPRNETESVWSSLATPTTPVVTTQSYTFPTSIVTLSHTTTLKGITHKSLLLGLNSGHIMMLRKDILDPRRNITPTQDMMEEGLPIYIPELRVEPKVFINYNQTIAEIQGILTTPTGLESTSLVFAYGLDLYLTRVTPSKQFDMLAEDFDYLLIAGVVGTLILATIVFSRLSMRKTLNLLWQ